MIDKEAKLIWEAYLTEAVIDTEMQLTGSAIDGGFEFIVMVDGVVFTTIEGNIIDDSNAPGQKAIEITTTDESRAELRGKGYGSIAYSELAQWAADNGMTNVYSHGSVSPSATGVYKSLGKRDAYQHTQHPSAKKAHWGAGKQDYKWSTADSVPKNQPAPPAHRLNIANQPLSGRYKQQLDYDSEGTPVTKRPTKTTYV